jgi:hypothetical protein
MAQSTHSTTIPLPAGAVAADEFEVHRDGRCLRLFQGARRGTDDVHVDTVGMEERNGPVVWRAIVVDGYRLGGGRIEIDAATARELARALIAAADELAEAEGQR